MATAPTRPQLEVIYAVHALTIKNKMAPTILEISNFRGKYSYTAILAAINSGFLKKMMGRHRGLALTEAGLALVNE